MKLTNEYIRGLVDGEGCFTFTTTKYKKGSAIITKRIPAFAIAMNERDRGLIEAVRDHFEIKNRVYLHNPYLGDGYNRGKRSVLIVREFPALKNVIVPFFYKKLKGHKAKQFESWILKIGSDSAVPASFKLIHRLYISGYWDKNPKYTD
ncbi:MAG: LAGLIDADG family homing endonuclease [bacterium]|nr:LAGLIDADG family homing endonuclease [bacterium]